MSETSDQNAAAQPSQADPSAQAADDALEAQAPDGRLDVIDDAQSQADADQAPAANAIDDAAQQEMVATVEAVLFASDAPLPPSRISQVAQLSGASAVRRAVRTLNQRYDQAGSAFRIELIAGGYQMLTLAQYHDVLSRLYKARSEGKLTQASLETLAIVAYRQPILRADVEAIRGVACGEVIRTLMERQMVKIVGRAEVLGRPMLYGTTKRFLEVFGLASLEDLPNVQELRSGKGMGGKSPAAVPAAQPEQAQQAPASADQTAAPADQALADQAPAPLADHAPASLADQAPEADLPAQDQASQPQSEQG